MLRKLREDALQWWFLKDEQERKKTSKNALLILVLGSLISYNMWMKNKSGDVDESLTQGPSVEEMPLASQDAASILEKDISEAATAGMEVKSDEIDARISQKVEELLATQSQVSPPINEEYNSPVSPDFPSGVSLPPPVELSGQNYSFEEPSGQQFEAPQADWGWGGGTVNTGGATANDYKKSQNTIKQSNVREIDLPVGFMKATLLVGINARSGEFGQSNPQQIVFNVSAPAQLPNRIKLNLKGCFVVANANGDLSAKRIEALPVSMNCLTQNGEYKITSSSLKGFVQDADGKRGLDARVVSRARHLLASTLFAKTVTGFGKVISAQGFTSTNTAIGSTTTPNDSEVARTALAGGFAEGFDDLGDYLLDLAKQIQPTLEHGAGKNVLIWVAEASTLKIEEVKK